VEEIYDVRALIPKIFAHRKEHTDSVFFPFPKVKGIKEEAIKIL